MKKKIILIIALIIVSALSIFTFVFFQKEETQTNELKEKITVAASDYFQKYVSANDSVNVYKITLEDLKKANENGENYDLTGLENCDENKTFASVTIDYTDGSAKKTQVELQCK